MGKNKDDSLFVKIGVIEWLIDILKEVCDQRRSGIDFLYVMCVIEQVCTTN